MDWFTFVDGWDGPSLANTILGIFVGIGSMTGYWLGRRATKKDRRIERDELIAEKMMNIMSEQEMDHFIGYLRGAHRYADRDMEKFAKLWQELQLQSNIFYDYKLERERINLQKRSQNLYEFILLRFFDVSAHTYALQPDHNPDRTGLFDESDPKTSQYLEWAKELDKLSWATFDSYRQFIKSVKRLRS